MPVGTIHLRGNSETEKYIGLSFIILSSVLFLSYRKIQQLKKKVRSKARVEGRIIEAKLV